MNSVPFIVMGMSSMLLQIVVLRLLLTTFSGNELNIGITLSFWLIWVGIGSFTGVRLRLKHAFVLSFIFISFLSLPTVLFIRAIKPILSLEPGEIVPFISTVFSTALSLLPLCFIIGVQFPVAVSYAGGGDAAGRVYSLEAIGAFIGGVIFTLIISGRIAAMELCFILALINIVMAVFIAKRKIISLLAVIPLFLYIGFQNIADRLPWQHTEPSHIVESKYGEIVVIRVNDQSSVFVNGQIVFTYPEPQSEELRTHLPMALHPSPSKILVVGGSLGTMKEFLKYPVKSIDFVELDPGLVEVSLWMLNDGDRKAVRDQKVNIIVEDGRRFIKRLERPTYDLIVLNLPQPSTASINRFYTADFFREVKGVLKEGGIVAMTVPQSTGYIGRGMQMSSGAIYNSLNAVFRYVEVTAQDYGGLFASDDQIITDTEILQKRLTHRPMELRYFNRYLFRDIFFPLNVKYVRERLTDIKVVNTDLQPSAYLYNLMLWTEVHGGRALTYLLKLRGLHIVIFLAIVLSILSFFTFRRKRRVIFYSIFTTGFSGMSFTLAVILAYQAAYGYIYEMIGMLIATFMIGLGAGAYLAKRVERAFTVLFCLEIMTVILALSSPLFFRAEFLFYLLCLLSGLITGGQFSTANLFMGELRMAGRLYGLDIIGSCAGAFIPAMIFIPLFGVPHTLLIIVAIKVVSALLLLSLQRGSG